MTAGRPVLPSGLYAIADSGFGDPVALGEALFAAGCPIVQIRCKGWTDEDTTRAAAVLAGAARAHDSLLVVNDRVAVAAAVGAHGVHLGQGDGDLAGARRSLGPQGLIGRSTHDLAQVRAACSSASTADYIGFGPVFGTTTKTDADRVKGVEALAAAVTASVLPVVAIGGIGPGNLGQVKSVRAHGWAVISALLTATDLEEAVRALR